MTRSDTIAQLAGALAKAQGAIKAATKDATNPHFKSKYADLASVWDACRDPLAKNELAVIQPVSVSDGRVHVVTLLTHGSGEWISETLDLTPGSDTPQAIGSAITYGRRYGLSAMVGVAPDDDDDGDATRQSNGQAKPNSWSRNPPPARSANPASEFISSDQQKALIGAAREYGWTGEELAKWLKDSGYNAWGKVPSGDYSKVLATLQGGDQPPAEPTDDSPLAVADGDIPF